MEPGREDLRTEMPAIRRKALGATAKMGDRYFIKAF
jgi:hypothetical protein